MRHLESELQIQIVDYLLANGIFCMHIANERNTGVVELKRLARMGVKKGAPDLIVFVNGRWHWWELKTTTGKQSLEQKCFMGLASKLGVEYHIVRCLQDATNLVNSEVEVWGESQDCSGPKEN